MTAAAILGSAQQILEALACGQKCDCRAAARRGYGLTHCPVHADPSPSLNVQERDGRVLVKCHADCQQAEIIAELRTRGLWAERSEVRNGHDSNVVATYDYRDAERRMLHQTVRFAPKSFRQRRPDGHGGWIWNLRDTETVLYRLPELRAADPDVTVYVVEGEKDADRLAAEGLVAITSPMGAGKWRDSYSTELRGRQVVILPDNDEPGRRHAQQIAASLGGVATSSRVVDLPGLPEHGDVSDWLEHHSKDDLVAACAHPTSPSAAAWPEPEDRGDAVLSALGAVEYVEDLVRPGHIVTVAAEEGTGKSFAVGGELAIRKAAAGGSFAGTWPIRKGGHVLVMSEMHSDDDFQREQTVLSALELERSALKGRYYRLPLMTAAHGKPALAELGWREWVLGWCKAHAIVLLVLDTATGATLVDPWGQQIQAVFRDLRLMLDGYPELAIVLVVHCKKPSNGHRPRGISDVIGEWARWCDTVLLLERDGPTRTRLTTFKRVRHERRIVVTKRGGLLVEPKDVSGDSGPKVPLEKVVDAVCASPGLTPAELGRLLKVTEKTARRYAAAAEASGDVHVDRTGPRGGLRMFPPLANGNEPGNPVIHGNQVLSESLPGFGEGSRSSGHPPYKGMTVPSRPGSDCAECGADLADVEEQERGVCVDCARALVSA